MKLFVWRDVYCDYSCGMAFAIATDVEQARKLASLGRYGLNSLPGRDEVGGSWKSTLDTLNAAPSITIDDELLEEPEVYDLEHPIGFGMYGGS